MKKKKQELLDNKKGLTLLRLKLIVIEKMQDFEISAKSLTLLLIL